MKGQWLGRYQSNTQGSLLIDIDEVDSGYQGYAVLQSEQAGMPVVFTRFLTANHDPIQEMTVNLFCLDPRNLEPTDWSNVQQFFPGVTLDPTTDVKLKLENSELVVEWTSPNGTVGTSRLPKTKAGTPSLLKPISIKNWREFKDYVETLPPNKFSFRGQQSNQWRLRTTFHRTGRANLERFSLVDIPAVSKHLSAQTRHLFNLSDSLQYGAFVSLIQHHGYPTPLLDWTHSPFVAAFFCLSRPAEGYR